MYTCTALLRDNIVSLLLANKRTQSSLCDHLGVNRSWASKLIRQRRDIVSMVHLDQIALYFGVEIYELFLPLKHPVKVENYFPFQTGPRNKETQPRNPKGMGSRPRPKPAKRPRQHPIEIAASLLKKKA